MIEGYIIWRILLFKSGRFNRTYNVYICIKVTSVLFKYSYLLITFIINGRKIKCLCMMSSSTFYR